MSQFSNHTVTLAGRAALARSWERDEPLKLLRIVIGDGDVPDIPEELVELVSLKANVAISTKRDLGNGQVAVRGIFRPQTILEGFYLREIGLIAEGEQEGEEILFCYAHAGELADYMSPADATSLMDEVLTLTLVTGSAEVLIQDIDPNAVLTIRDLEERFHDLNIDELREDIGEARDEIEVIKEELGSASQGYVKKSGDRMEGALEAPEFIGKLAGSAELWSGWTIYESVEKLSLNAVTANMNQIVTAMANQSRLIAYLGTANPNMPGAGMLEVQRVTQQAAIACFTCNDGTTWKGARNGGMWSGWTGCHEVPPGTILAFDGGNVPLGYVALNGQWLEQGEYPRLFAVVGYRYGQSGTRFQVQDARGVALRGWDNGRGLDTGRSLGSYQEDAMQNVTGRFNPGGNGVDGSASGAFYTGGDAVLSNLGGASDSRMVLFDASRVARTGNETRMKNVAVQFIQKY